MARDFSKNTANYMRLGIDAISPDLNGATDISVSVWLVADSLDTAALNNTYLSWDIDAAATGGRFNIGNATPVARTNGRSQAADANQAVNGTTTISTGTLYQMGGVLDINGDKNRVYVNGTQEANTAVTYGAASYTDGAATASDAIGDGIVTPPVATAGQFDGRLEELAIWKTDVASATYTLLGMGYSPAFFGGSNLVGYWMLKGMESPEPNFVSGGESGTITGTVAAAAQNRHYIYPWAGAGVGC